MNTSTASTETKTYFFTLDVFGVVAASTIRSLTNTGESSAARRNAARTLTRLAREFKLIPQDATVSYIGVATAGNLTPSEKSQAGGVGLLFVTRESGCDPRALGDTSILCDANLREDAARFRALAARIYSAQESIDGKYSYVCRVGLTLDQFRAEIDKDRTINLQESAT
jgi:hypothetical protein